MPLQIPQNKQTKRQLLFIPGSAYIYGIHFWLSSGCHCVHFYYSQAGACIVKPVFDTIPVALQYLRCLITMLKSYQNRLYLIYHWCRPMLQRILFSREKIIYGFLCFPTESMEIGWKATLFGLKRYISGFKDTLRNTLCHSLSTWWKIYRWHWHYTLTYRTCHY